MSPARCCSALSLLLAGCGHIRWELGPAWTPAVAPPDRALVVLYRPEKFVNGVSTAHVAVQGRERTLVNGGYAVVVVDPGAVRVAGTLGGIILDRGGSGQTLTAPASMGDAMASTPVGEANPAATASLYRSDASLAMSTAQLNSMTMGPSGETHELATWTMYGLGMEYGRTPTLDLDLTPGSVTYVRVEVGIAGVRLAEGDAGEVAQCKRSPGGERYYEAISR